MRDRLEERRRLRVSVFNFGQERCSACSRLHFDSSSSPFVCALVRDYFDFIFFMLVGALDGIG